MWTVACQSPLSMGFPRQEYWSGLPSPSPGDLPDPRIQPASPALAGGFSDSLPWSHQGSPCTLGAREFIIIIFLQCFPVFLKATNSVICKPLMYQRSIKIFYPFFFFVEKPYLLVLIWIDKHFPPVWVTVCLTF